MARVEARQVLPTAPSLSEVDVDFDIVGSARSRAVFSEWSPPHRNCRRAACRAILATTMTLLVLVSVANFTLFYLEKMKIETLNNAMNELQENLDQSLRMNDKLWQAIAQLNSTASRQNAQWQSDIAELWSTVSQTSSTTSVAHAKLSRFETRLSFECFSVGNGLPALNASLISKLHNVHDSSRL